MTLVQIWITIPIQEFFNRIFIIVHRYISKNFDWSTALPSLSVKTNIRTLDFMCFTAFPCNGNLCWCYWCIVKKLIIHSLTHSLTLENLRYFDSKSVTSLAINCPCKDLRCSMAYSMLSYIKSLAAVYVWRCSWLLQLPWAAPRILRWDVNCTRQDSRAERKNIFVPPLFQMWGLQASKYQYGPIEYIAICCVVVALINIIYAGLGLWYYGIRERDRL